MKLLGQRRMEPRELLEIVRGRPQVFDLLLCYCKARDFELLKRLCVEAELSSKVAGITVRSSMRQEVFTPFQTKK